MNGPYHCRAARLRPAGGFSLVEMLAALAVFTLILEMLFQIFNNTVAATQASRQQMDATQQGRQVLDSLGEDLTYLVLQEGAATIFVKDDGPNSRITFLTRSRGPKDAADFRFLAVSYRLEGNELVRGTAPVAWSDKELMPRALAADTVADPEILTQNALRFQFMLILDNGQTVPLSQPGLWKTNTLSETQLPPDYYALTLAGPVTDPANPRVRSIAVAVAALDPQNMKFKVADSLAVALGNPALGQTPSEKWNAALATGDLSGFPRPVVTALRVVQSTFPLR